MLRQLRYAFRVLAARPGFALAVVAILGLGVGLDTAIFNFINAMLIRPRCPPWARSPPSSMASAPAIR